MTDRKAKTDPNTCTCCGTKSPSVDCCGIYACPNKFCFVTGAWNVRLAAGYQDDEGHQTYDQLSKMLRDCHEEEAACVARLKVLLTCKDKIQKYLIQEALVKP